MGVEEVVNKRVKQKAVVKVKLGCSIFWNTCSFVFRFCEKSKSLNRDTGLLINKFAEKRRTCSTENIYACRREAYINIYGMEEGGKQKGDKMIKTENLTKV
ncbi:hypothetical protein C5S32_02650, partial [ANME-1 cluster archaeon GoMg1]|nr:hypothetical protein [ANME-1 cluster archaeon GoMg1]